MHGTYTELLSVRNIERENNCNAMYLEGSLFVKWKKTEAVFRVYNEGWEGRVINVVS